jgi:hypothetical protein
MPADPQEEELQGQAEGGAEEGGAEEGGAEEGGAEEGGAAEARLAEVADKAWTVAPTQVRKPRPCCQDCLKSMPVRMPVNT